MDILSDIYLQFLSINNPIINLLMVMVIIWTTGVLFRMIRQPPVIGELLAGFIFGPFMGPIFFISLSFHIDFTILTTHPLLLITLLLAAVVGKVAGAGGGALLGQMNKGEAMVIGAQ